LATQRLPYSIPRRLSRSKRGALDAP